MSLGLKMLILFQNIIEYNLKHVENNEYTLHSHGMIRIVSQTMWLNFERLWDSIHLCSIKNILSVFFLNERWYIKKVIFPIFDYK